MSRLSMTFKMQNQHCATYAKIYHNKNNSYLTILQLFKIKSILYNGPAVPINNIISIHAYVFCNSE